MRVVIFSPYFPPAYLGGGPARAIGAMVRTLPEGTSAAVVTGDTDLGVPLDVPRDAWVDWGSARVRYVSAGSSKAWWRALVAARSLRPDVVFVNGFFAVRFSMIPQLLSRLGLF